MTRASEALPHHSSSYDGRRLTPKALATRTRIIESATDLFANDGYAAVTVRGIAAETGLSSGAIYATFRGKADLLVEAVRASITEDLATLPASIVKKTLPEIDAYQFTISSSARRQRSRKLLLEAAVAARTDDDVRDQLSTILQARVDDWTAAHTEWKRASGVARGTDMRALTTLLVSIDLGMGVLSALGVETPSPQQSSALVLQLMESLNTSEPVRRAPKRARS